MTNYARGITDALHDRDSTLARYLALEARDHLNTEDKVPVIKQIADYALSQGRRYDALQCIASIAKQ
jgi:hypothetical protein